MGELAAFQGAVLETLCLAGWKNGRVVASVTESWPTCYVFPAKNKKIKKKHTKKQMYLCLFTRTF